MGKSKSVVMGNNDGKVSKENRIVVPKKGRIVRRSSASALVVCVCCFWKDALSHGLWLVHQSEAIHLLHTFCN